MIYIHVIAGLLSLAAGAVALYATKGSRLHRKSGMVFVVAMLVMTLSAAFVATFISPNRGNVIAAALTFYLVCTALLTVRRPVAETPLLLAGLMLIGLTVGLQALQRGFEVLANPGDIPAPAIFMFAVVGITGAALDARLLWVGNIAGAHRLARHLWRMTYAMWIATSSFFLGQADEFPEPVRKIALLAIPVLIVTFLLFYWLARVLIKRARAVPQLEPVRSAS